MKDRPFIINVKIPEEKIRWTDKIQALSTLGLLIIGIVGLIQVGKDIEDIKTSIENQTASTVNLVESIKLTTTVNVCLTKNGAKFNEWKDTRCGFLRENEILFNEEINQSCSIDNEPVNYLFAYIERINGSCNYGFKRII